MIRVSIAVCVPEARTANKQLLPLHSIKTYVSHLLLGITHGAIDPLE